MCPVLLITACLFVALGLRLSVCRWVKKLAVLVFLCTMGLLGYFLFGHLFGVVIGAGVWFLLPLVVIYRKCGQAHFPIEPPEIPMVSDADESFFPQAEGYRAQLEEIGFEAVENHSWQWLDAHHHHRFFWHPELHTIASLCLCELDKVAFSYVILHSELACGRVLRTTNYPFTSPLQHPPHIVWKHVPCEEKQLPTILSSHRRLIKRYNTEPCKLRMPDPEGVGETWLGELRRKTEHNLAKGVIQIREGSYRYTARGYLHLWWQAVKDLVRLC